MVMQTVESKMHLVIPHPALHFWQVFLGHQFNSYGIETNSS